MTNFVIGLLIVQLIMGGYLLSFVLGAGQKLSSARATRLPDPVVFVHPVLAVTTTGLWILYMASGYDGLAWATLVTLLVTASGGVFLWSRTAFADDKVHRPAADPADVRVAEKQIPGLALAVHAVGAVTLVVCTLLVALEIAG